MRVNEHQVLATITRDSFYEFLKEFWHIIVHDELVENWHLEYLCNELQEVAERVVKGETKKHDLVINVPPGSSKSTICSQMFPAWVWTKMPHAQFICGSYAHTIALKDSLKTRDIVQSELYQKCFPGIELREDENTKGMFRNTKKGFRYAVSVGGAVTGQHGHFLIIDDPLNPEEAMSEADLKTVNRWMETTLPSRKLRFLGNVVPTILIQQRLHQDDPSGRMVERGKSKRAVKHICLPGELTDAVSPESLRDRYLDGLFDPIRLSRDVLDEMRDELGEYGFASQILQQPVPLGGGLFKVDKFVLVDDAPKRIVRRIRSWDKAGTEDGGKYSAGVLLGLDQNNLYWVLDVVRGQWGATRREAMIKQTAEMDGDGVEIILEVEGGSGGKESGENTVRNLAGFHVTTYHPTGDKYARAYPFASQVGLGDVHVLRRDWTKDFLDEYRFFPKGRFADQVDAGGAAFSRLARKKKRIGGMRLKGR